MGSNEKTAEEFFSLIKDNNVRRVVDVRLKNQSGLLGFTRQANLPYLLQKIAGIEYEHWIELGPDESILGSWQAKKITWSQYEELFIPLLRNRRVEEVLVPDELDRACLLCAESAAEECHRRLVAEYFLDRWAGRVQIEIIHILGSKR